MTVMMIVIVEVVGEVMVIIDIVDNQYTRGWKQAILPASGWGQGQGLQGSPGAGCRVAACACDHDGDNIG